MSARVKFRDRTLAIITAVGVLLVAGVGALAGETRLLPMTAPDGAAFGSAVAVAPGGLSAQGVP